MPSWFPCWRAGRNAKAFRSIGRGGLMSLCVRPRSRGGIRRGGRLPCLPGIRAWRARRPAPASGPGDRRSPLQELRTPPVAAVSRPPELAGRVGTVGLVAGSRPPFAQAALLQKLDERVAAHRIPAVLRKGKAAVRAGLRLLQLGAAGRTIARERIGRLVQ